MGASADHHGVGRGGQDGGPRGLSQGEAGPPPGLRPHLLSSGDDGDGSKYDSHASQEERAGGQGMHWRDCIPLISESQPRGGHSCWVHPPFRSWCRKGAIVLSNALFLPIVRLNIFMYLRPRKQEEEIILDHGVTVFCRKRVSLPT